MRSLWFRLIGAFAIVIAMTLIIVSFVVNLVAAHQFDIYVAGSGKAITHHLAPLLADSYRRSGSWGEAQSILSNPKFTEDAQDMMGTSGPRFANSPTDDLGFELLLVDLHGEVVADSSGQRIGEVLPRPLIKQGTPIRADKHVVIGRLLVMRPQADSPARLAFLSQVRHGVIFAAVASGLAALVIGTLLFQRIIQPLRSLQSAAHRVAAGDLTARVPITSDDELSEVAAAFNQMASNLDQQQSLRKQMVADIAHELRNPISVMQGTLEAMEDGLIRPTPQELSDLHDDVRRLARLVEDLRTLSLADAGQLALIRDSLNLSETVEHVASRMSSLATERGISLKVDAAQHLPAVNADEDRIAQVIGNLLDNALRHTPPGGQVIVRTHLESSSPNSESEVTLEVSDTGPGIPEADLPYVFERFWRGDRSRSRESGGSGLGLAIARQLIELHGGSIRAESSPGRGATFRITLPTLNYS